MNLFEVYQVGPKEDPTSYQIVDMHGPDRQYPIVMECVKHPVERTGIRILSMEVEAKWFERPDVRIVEVVSPK